MRNLPKPTDGNPWAARRPPTDCHPWAWIVGAAAVLFALPSAQACNIPVFRYAIERWFPEPYHVIVFHRGPLTGAEKKLVGWLEHYGDKTLPTPAGTASDPRAANLTVNTCDLTPWHEAVPVFAGPWAAAVVDAVRLRFPWLVVRYPEKTFIPRDAWNGPFTATTARALLDSPVRRRMARRLVWGESAVWVLVESGDKQADDAAHALLDKQLRHLEKTLELPKLTSSPRDQLLFADGPKLRIGFSILRVARDDAAESVLVRMLLHSEEELAARREPMVFPIFGRGLVLYALVGKGITEENIDAAGRFIVGACRCEARNENPGTDLLLTEDWEGGLTGRLTRTPLLGFADIVPPETPPPPVPAASLGWSRLVQGIALAIGGGFIVTLVISSLLFSDKRRRRSGT